jgi:molybdopterin-synthase adenylyltransferase
MNDEQLLRYSRHILLNEFGVEAQECLLASTVLVVGAGGLGSAALLYLASAGVGRIVVADGDEVDRTNLQRQIIHREDAIGVNKAESAASTLAQINSGCSVQTIPRRLESAELLSEVGKADIVLDCSDNFSTRHAINKACVRHGKPLVSGAAIRFDGQITSFDLRRVDSPCYHCLFPESASSEEERCAIMGVFAPLVGIIGAMQAGEAIRMLAGVGQSLTGKLSIFDGLSHSWHQVRLTRDPACAVCGTSAVHQRRVDHALA